MKETVLEDRLTNGDTLVDTTHQLLSEQDLDWLNVYNPDITLNHLDTLNSLIELGSKRTNEPENKDIQSDIVIAREWFYRTVNVPESALDFCRKHHPNFAPLDTFIDSQRTMYSLGLDMVRILKKEPMAINYTADSVREKVSNLNNLGLDAIKIINAMPTALGLNLEYIREKVANLTVLGLNSVRVVNSMPATINYTPESVKEKVENLNALGLDAISIINTMPAAISYAPESVRRKVNQITRYSKVLGWEHNVIDLINYQPGILSYSSKRLSTLARIAASNIPAITKQVDKKVVTQALIAPLDDIIIALSENVDKISSATDLVNIAVRANKQSKAERQERAKKLAPHLGRTGRAYLRYRNKD